LFNSLKVFISLLKIPLAPFAKGGIRRGLFQRGKQGEDFSKRGDFFEISFFFLSSNRIKNFYQLSTIKHTWCIIIQKTYYNK